MNYSLLHQELLFDIVESSFPKTHCCGAYFLGKKINKFRKIVECFPFGSRLLWLCCLASNKRNWWFFFSSTYWIFFFLHECVAHFNFYFYWFILKELLFFIFWVFGCLFYDKTWEKEMGVLHLGKWEFWILFSFFSNGKFPNKYYTYNIGKERHEVQTRPIRLGRG